MSRIPHDYLNERITLIDCLAQAEMVATAQSGIGVCVPVAESDEQGSCFKVGEQQRDGVLPHIPAPRVADMNEPERLHRLSRSLPRPEPFDDDCSLLTGTFA